MAIQIPNAGTGNGATGDNEFVLWTKVINNFSDQTNAASRLVGTGAEQIPLSKNIPSLLGTAATKNTGVGSGNIPLNPDVKRATLSYVDVLPSGTNIDNVTDTGFYAFRSFVNGVNGNIPDSFSEGVLEVRNVSYNAGYTTRKIQILTTTDGKNGLRRISEADGKTWLGWTAYFVDENIYKTTTASGANVVVDSTGKLMRSTSSERYKDILAPLELDGARYEAAMALKPIVYRSTADADNPAYHYYSFSAEELGTYDPAFTLWRETETVTDEDGNVTEQPLAERQAEGININALLAMSHAIAIKQGKIIKALEARIETLESK